MRILELAERRRAALASALERNARQRDAWSDVAIRDADLERLLRSAEALVMGDENAPRGILLFGPPGTGKTLIAKRLADSSGCTFVPTSIGDFKGPNVGESETKTLALWASLRKRAPCILFVDECDMVLSGRGALQNDQFDRAITGAFIQAWDGMQDSVGVMVIGATNRKAGLDEAVISRFASQIRVDLPGTADRIKIVNARLRKSGFSFTVGEVTGRVTAGLSGRDIDNALKQFAVDWPRHSDADESTLAEAFKSIRAKSGNMQTSEVFGWESLVASRDKKREFQRIAVLLRSAEQMRAKGLTVPNGMLLFGPPGTGKTQVGRILASESGLTFFKATSSELKAGWIGHSGNFVRELFEKARASAPALLFIDEIDVVAPRRGARSGDSFTNEIVGELLQQMNGIEGSSNVFVLAASNVPDDIDPAILSRFQNKIELPLPDQEERIEILRLHLARKPSEGLTDDIFRALGVASAGMSGRDLAALVQHAEGFAIDEIIDGSGDPEQAVIREVHLARAAGRLHASSARGAR